MTTDRYNEEIFLGYLEGDLTPQQTVEFEKLMVEDPRLRNLVAQMVLDRHRLRKMPDEPPPAEVMQAARESLERQMLLTPHKTNGGEPTPARRLLLSRWITYASLAAMIVLIAGLVVRTLTDQPILSMSKKHDAKHDAKIAKPDLGKNKANTPAPLVAMSPASTSNDKDDNAESLDQRSPERLTGEGASLARTAAPSPDRPDATLAKRQLTSVESKDSLMKEFTGGGRAAYADRAPSGQAGAASVAMMQPPAAPATIPAAPRDAAPKSAPRERVFISRYVNEDVPLPPPWDAVTNDAGAPQQLQLTAESREAGEKEIRAWASANHATVLTVAMDQEPVAARAAAGNVAREEVERRRTSADRQLIVLLPRQRVPKLVAHLNGQAANSASLVVLADEYANDKKELARTEGLARESVAQTGAAANAEVAAEVSTKPAEQKTLAEASSKLRGAVAADAMQKSEPAPTLAQTATPMLKADEGHALADAPSPAGTAGALVALPIVIHVPAAATQPAAP